MSSTVPDQGQKFECAPLDFLRKELAVVCFKESWRTCYIPAYITLDRCGFGQLNGRESIRADLITPARSNNTKNTMPTPSLNYGGDMGACQKHSSLT